MSVRNRLWSGFNGLKAKPRTTPLLESFRDSFFLSFFSINPNFLFLGAPPLSHYLLKVFF